MFAAVLGGLLLATLVEVAGLAAGLGLRAIPAFAPITDAWSSWLYAGGWFAFPLWGAGVGLLIAARGAAGWTRARRLVVAAVLLAAPLALRPALNVARGNEPPRTARAKLSAMRRWSFRSPETVGRVLSLADDPDPVVRENAMLTLGINRIVKDIEGSLPSHPSALADHPLRARIRDRLRTALEDSVEAVRAEAARALWNAPRTFGVQRAAAETLAAVLDRADRPGALERLTWLALDAAAGAPDSALKGAAERFADRTTDAELARVARAAAHAAGTR